MVYEGNQPVTGDQDYHKCVYFKHINFRGDLVEILQDLITYCMANLYIQTVIN